MAAQAPTTMDLWLEEPSARSPGSEELHFQQLTKQSLLLLVKFYDPASQTLRVRVCLQPGSCPVRYHLIMFSIWLFLHAATYRSMSVNY